jgi:hypothetical protein
MMIMVMMDALGFAINSKRNQKAILEGKKTATTTAQILHLSCLTSE